MLFIGKPKGRSKMIFNAYDVIIVVFFCVIFDSDDLVYD